MLRFGSREVAAAAVMSALVCAATLLIQIPIPATQGFFNVGDAMVMVASLTFGPIVGFFAGGVGSALADFVGGWYVWVPFTLVVKGIEGFVSGAVVGWDGGRAPWKLVLAWLVGGLVMVSGYFLVQWYMYGVSAALAEAPFNVVQMAVGGIIGIPLSAALRRRLET